MSEPRNIYSSRTPNDDRRLRRGTVRPEGRILGRSPQLGPNRLRKQDPYAQEMHLSEKAWGERADDRGRENVRRWMAGARPRQGQAQAAGKRNEDRGVWAAPDRERGCAKPRAGCRVGQSSPAETRCPGPSRIDVCGLCAFPGGCARGTRDASLRGGYGGDQLIMAPAWFSGAKWIKEGTCALAARRGARVTIKVDSVPRRHDRSQSAVPRLFALE